ncbi:MAG: CBS domain-containing protein [Betaproteobacteria bacterium]|jgi:CBS domain-containing protein|nr:CBS domain-containing protein [Betaproteobacteria bacterium]
MSSVKSCIEKKSGVVFSLPSTASVQQALELMRNNRIRSVMVIDDGALAGIVTQGDCAIKVLLPGLSATQTLVSEIMTRSPLTVTMNETLQQCMAIMTTRNFRHLPVLDKGRVLGMVSIGDIVKDIMSLQGDQIMFLETYIKGHGAA